MLADVFDEFGRPFRLTSPADVSVDVVLLFWERPSEASLTSLRTPHDGPVAEILISALVNQGLPQGLEDFRLAALSPEMSGRMFICRRSPRTKSGLCLRLELAEQA